MENSIPQNTPQKQCRRCKQFFPKTREFFHYARKKSGVLQSHCIPCRAVIRQERHPPQPKEQLPEGYRRCTKCKEIYPATIDYFEPTKHNHIGLRPSCRQCRAKEWKVYNDDHALSYNQYYQLHKKEIAKRSKQHYETHWEQIRKQRRQKYVLQTRERTGRYQRTHVEQYRTYNHNHHARKKAVPGTYTTAQIAEQLKRQHYRCYYAACGFAKFKHVKGRYVYTIEHTFPITREYARNEISHIVLSCPSCNSKKGNKYPHEWPEGGRLL